MVVSVKDQWAGPAAAAAQCFAEKRAIDKNITDEWNHVTKRNLVSEYSFELINYEKNCAVNCAQCLSVEDMYAEFFREYSLCEYKLISGTMTGDPIQKTIFASTDEHNKFVSTHV